MNDDSEIRDAIGHAMVLDKRLSAQAIEISVKEGVVRLAGVVQSHRRALAALELASSWPGVRDVVNELRVEPPGIFDDAQIADNVRAALDASEDVVKGAILVGVTSAVVTLEGSVAESWQVLLAEDVTRSARGVRDVRNLLVANRNEFVNDEEAAHELQELIRRTCRSTGTDIRVAVTGHKVVLSGTSTVLAQKDLALNLARRLGYLDIRNEIRVSPV